MRFMIKCTVIAIMAVLMTVPTAAKAGFVLGLQYSDGSITKTVNSGDVVFVDLVLRGTLDEILTLQNDGLITGGGRIVQSSGAISFSAAAVTNPAGQWDLFFDDAPVSSGTGIELAKALGASIAPIFPTLPGGGPFTSILIAAFQFTATGAGGDTATLTADILDPGGSFNLTGDPSFIDVDFDPGLTFGSIDLSINGAAAVPEPATVVLGSLSLCMAGAAAWRRRRNQKKSDVSV